MRLVVTGAAGYLGSHACVALQQQGHAVVGVDNFANSSPVVLERIAELSRPMRFIEGDVTDRISLAPAFDPTLLGGPIDAVLHFAGRKFVGESAGDPTGYLRTNVGGTVTLLDVMRGAGVGRIVFSSSCTVYGEGTGGTVPVTETTPVAPTNPYGMSKAMAEQAIAQVCAADPTWRAISLRYFNPIGAHPSGRLGESPLGPPQTLLPRVMGVAAGRFDRVNVFGDDYPTPDGTCVRDYLHVSDLIDGHVSALQHLCGPAPSTAFGPDTERHTVVNLGTGTGSSVRDLLRTAERVTGRAIPHVIEPRRTGDAASVTADPALARDLLGWRSTRDLEAMCADHWRWQRSHPRGYSSNEHRSTEAA